MTEPLLRGDVQPVGAVLRIGMKATAEAAARGKIPADKAKGQPILRDRFLIARREESPVKLPGRNAEGEARLLHPAFEWFNSRSLADPVTELRGEFVHPRREQLFQPSRRAQTCRGWAVEGLKAGAMHPNRAPYCRTVRGDHSRAERLVKVGQGSEPDTYEEIPCPGRVCEYNQEIGGRRDCTVASRLLFAPRWKDSDEDRPRPLMLFSTHGWGSSEAIEGFLQYLETVAADLALPEFSFLGIPFIMSLEMKKDRKRGNAYPVVSFTLDGNPAEIFTAQKWQVEQIGGHQPRLLVAALTDESEAGEVEDADFVDVSAVVPSQGSLIEDAP